MSKVEKILGIGSVVATAVMPALTSAAAILDLSGGNDASTVYANIITVINSYVIPAIVVIATLYFIYGVLKYVMNADNEEARKKAQEGMIYGIIGLVVMFGFWGIVKVVQSAFGLDAGVAAPINYPQVPIVS